MQVTAFLFFCFTSLPNKNINDKRGVDYVKNTFSDIENILGNNYFDKLFSEIQLETNINNLGIENIEELVKDVNADRLKNNPIKLSFDDLAGLFSQKRHL
ncbi:MAG: hypothetical protein Ta2B_24430 [Termitinemataceae bacterium]|nr:MAG: hypothetical protein Ta2B_24430 [Termitinemataceae bacterium]